MRLLATVTASTTLLLVWWLWARDAPPDEDENDDDDDDDDEPRASSSKAERHMASWEQLNQSPGLLVLPTLAGEPVSAAHAEVCAAVEVRLAFHGARAGSRDWLVKTSRYAHGEIRHPHAAVKREVNAALAKATQELFPDLSARLRASPNEVLLVLDAPSYGTSRALAARCGAELLRSSQLVVPQADLGQYFAMVSRSADVYVGVRAQRLDHWLCAHAGHGLRVLVAFFDFESRALGRRSDRLCPMADVMRYFRFGYPADTSLLCLTVGLWPGPLGTAESVVAAVAAEATAAGYDVELIGSWSYRLVALLFRVTRRPRAACGGAGSGGRVSSSAAAIGPPPGPTETVPEAAAAAPPLPPPSSSLDAPVLPGGEAVDSGPVVVTASGQLRTVETWASLSEPDREWTRRQVGERNAQRLAHLHRVGGRFCFASTATSRSF